MVIKPPPPPPYPGKRGIPRPSTEVTQVEINTQATPQPVFQSPSTIVPEVAIDTQRTQPSPRQESSQNEATVVGPEGQPPDQDQNPDQQSSQNQVARQVTEETKLPCRLGYEKKGRAVTLWTNHVELKPPPDIKLFHYDLKITRRARTTPEAETAPVPAVGTAPEAKNTPHSPAGKKLGHAIYQLLKTVPELMDLCDEGDLVSDFNQTIITTRELASDPSSFNFTYCGEKSNNRGKYYTAELKFTKVLNVDDLLRSLEAKTLSEETNVKKEEFTQAFNIWLRHLSKYLSMVNEPQKQVVVGSEAFSLMGRSKVQQETERRLSGSTVAIRGFFSSIRMATARVLVNINVTHGAFHPAIPLNSLIPALGKEFGKNGLEGRRRWEMISKAIQGIRVRVELPRAEQSGSGSGSDSKTPGDMWKSIAGLALLTDGQHLDPRPEEPPKFGERAEKAGCGISISENEFGQSEEGGGNGRWVRVVDHFRTKYPGLVIKNDDIVVNLGNQHRPQYFPAGICFVVRGQSKMALTPGETREMIDFSVLDPSRSIDHIVKDGFGTIGIAPPRQGLLFNPNPDLITVPGHQLPSPQVTFGGVGMGGFASWNLRGNHIRYSKVAPCGAWAVLAVNEYRMEFSKDVAEILATKMKSRGMVVPEPTLHSDNKIENDVRSQSDAAGDVAHGVQTVCMRKKALKNDKTKRINDGQEENKVNQYIDNVLLKVNSKLGGDNQHVTFASQSLRETQGKTPKTMIVGLDVTHPSPGSADNAPSVAGMVASVDQHLQQWRATMEYQDKGKQEIAYEDCIHSLFKPHPTRWKDNHKEYPQNIIGYRDGVSEGQYNQVINQECAYLTAACSQLYGEQEQPKITAVVVGKRHHTRFYPLDNTGPDYYHRNNPKAGTVVDRGITSQFVWDFFLQAHEAIKGTTHPTHYVVVVDEVFKNIQKNDPLFTLSKFNNHTEILHDLTQALFYSFGRCTRAIGVCTPANLADKVCDGARFYSNNVYTTRTSTTSLPKERIRIHDNIKETMFFV
ncbi:Piwi domain-containing protein [Apodospora peruviana]|uniref:Piwi domain-containing protein n=1 Tax=Apodospora peruviana TaxID=516989 RepID=A0AAE0IRG2_9PEZI|nr:Piwi domain-containing protein [Apodospora peruviana]